MQFYKNLQLGQFHPIYCEDFLFAQHISQQWFVAAVFDGCSSGRDSHFASALLGKSLGAICKQLPYLHQMHPHLDLETIHIEELSNFILLQLFEQYQYQQNKLLLETIDLVSTCILLVYNQHQLEAQISLSGDGVFAINQNIEIIDQNDRPNYMAYHLHKKSIDWLEQECLHYRFSHVKDVAIATDGVLSFAQTAREKEDYIQASDYLLCDNQFQQQENMLDKKCIRLDRNYGQKPNDDVAIVRVINQN